MGWKEKEGGHVRMLPRHGSIPVCTVTPQQSPEDLPLLLPGFGNGQGNGLRSPRMFGKLQSPLPTCMSQTPIYERPPMTFYSLYSLGRVWN